MSTNNNLKLSAALVLNKRIRLSFEALKPAIDFSSLAIRASQVAQWWRIHLPMQVAQESWVRSLGQEILCKGNPLQYSCLENSMYRGAWQATVHWVAKNQTWLSTHAHTSGYMPSVKQCDFNSYFQVIWYSSELLHHPPVIPRMYFFLFQLHLLPLLKNTIKFLPVDFFPTHILTGFIVFRE